MQIIKQNKKGYLLAYFQGMYLLLDDYCGPLEPGDTVTVEDTRYVNGRHDYIKSGRRYWLNVAGDIGSVEVFDNSDL